VSIGDYYIIMKNQQRIMLIGDNHPEMLAIAKNLAERQIDFLIILPAFFHASEITTLKLFPRLHDFAIKRRIPIQIKSSHVRRPLFILELFIWVFGRIGFVRLSRILSKVVEHLYTVYILAAIKIMRPKTVITYDTFLVAKKNFQLIVICPAIHPYSHEQYMQTARLNAINWPVRGNDIKSYANIQTINSADNLVLFSKFAAETFQKNGIANNLITIINLGPKNIFNESGVIAQKREKMNIVFLGRLNVSKGISEIITASWSLSNRFSISLIGNCSDEIFEYIIAKSNPENVRVFRHQNNQEIANLISNAHVMLHPSYFEGFSISCIEGMRSGLVPIFSKNSGVAEILHGSELANLTVNPGDSQSLVKNIQYLDSLEWDQFNQLSKMARELSLNYSFQIFSNNFVQQFILKN
jgi:glycosyltransferase involved in cell wall biosynthesis